MLRPRALTAIAVALFAFLLAGARPARSDTAQPIGYSHKVHVTDNGIDCRTCHI